MKHVGYLIVSAAGEMRVLKRLHSMRPHEVAFKVVVTVPEGWEQVRGQIDVVLPDPPSEAILSEFPQ